MLARRGARLGGPQRCAMMRVAPTRAQLLRARLSVVAFTQQQPRADAPPVPTTWTRGRAADDDGARAPPLPLPPSLAPLGAAFDAALDRYWRASPTARAVVDAFWRRRYGSGPSSPAPLHHDHLAFRTFGGVPGHGIATLGAALRAWGYEPRDEGGRLVFPQKKLRAAWFSPPPGLEGALPRVFVSEIDVSRLSPAAAAVVRRYAGPPPPPAPAPSPVELASAAATAAEHQHQHQHPGSSSSSSAAAANAGAFLPPPRHHQSSLEPAHLRAWTCLVAGGLPWTEAPTLADWRLLADESEYAAWVLAHGYAVNHTALAVHRLEAREAERDTLGVGRAPPPSYDPLGERSSLAAFARELADAGFALNSDGGRVIKASPGDGGLLLQCSTVADVVDYAFADAAAPAGGGGGGGGAVAAATTTTAVTAPIPGAYLEFVERRPLPRFGHFSRRDLREWHRRDGFEQASADSIFASTTLAAGGGGKGGEGGGGGEDRGAAAAGPGAGAGIGMGGCGGGLILGGGGGEEPMAARALPKSASSGGASGSGA